MYTFLEAEAARAGLPLRWPSRLPDTRVALGTAEWVRIHRPSAAHVLNRSLFAAHFALAQDIGDVGVVLRYASEADVAVEDLRQAIMHGDTDALLLASEREARRLGVSGTPAWLIRGQLVAGLQPIEVFERLVAS